MSDENFDPCECIFSQEVAVRRLLSLLRNSQSYCTDNECFSEFPGPQSASPGRESNFFIFMLLWVAVAAVLFLMRPSSLRNRGDEKPNPNQGSGGGAPPSPDGLGY